MAENLREKHILPSFMLMFVQVLTRLFYCSIIKFNTVENLK